MNRTSFNGVSPLRHAKWVALPAACKAIARAGSGLAVARRLAAIARLLTAAYRIEVRLAESAVVSQHPNPASSVIWRDGKFEAGCSATKLDISMMAGGEIIGSLRLDTAEPLDKSVIECAEMLACTTAHVIRLRQLEAQLAVEQREAKVVSDALQETQHAMFKHREVGRMGDFRYNTRTKESFGTIECYWFFGNEPTAEEIELAKHPPYVIPLKVEFDNWTQQIVEEDRQRVIDTMQDAAETGSPYRFDYRILVGDEIRHISLDGALHPDHVGDPTYYGVMTDITERKRSEERLQAAQQELTAAQRLASLGELAASIIHEVSQPVTAIRTGLESCLRWMDQPDGEHELRAVMERVSNETLRASSVIGGLRALAKGVDTHLADIDIMDAAREALILVRSRAARGRVPVQAHIGRQAVIVRGDRVQLQQVLINLANNAVDAMAETAAEHRLLILESRCDDGAYVTFSVKDTGPGIAVDDTSRLFDPLYSTKNEGMGLGLAICRRIVNAHQGKISVCSNEPHGAVFEFQIPLVLPTWQDSCDRADR